MASIRRKLGSKYWFACFYREDGTRTQVSTKSTQRKEALKIADDLERAHKNKATESQMRRVLSDLNERLTGDPLKSATLTEYVEKWLIEKEVSVARVSFLAYRTAARAFLKYLEAKATLPLSHITGSDVMAFRNAVRRRTTERTASNQLKIVRVMLDSARVGGYVEKNAATDVPVFEKQKGTRRPFKVGELKRLMVSATGEWRGLILAGLYTGQRLKDLCLLTWASVDFAGNQISLTTSKTGRDQIIPMATPLADDMLSRVSDDPRGYVFPQTSALVLKDGDVGRVSQGFYDLLVKAGLAEERLGKDESKGIGRSAARATSPLTFHSLRHTATSMLKNAGVTELVARDLIGHDSAEVSANYSHVDEESKRRAIQGLPDITK